MEPLTYLCNATPNLSKLERNLPLILLHVDLGVICIGQRDEEAEAYCKSFGDKVRLVHYPWRDSFRDAYQACLDHAPHEGWHLRMDDDEVPSEGMLSELRTLILASDRGRKTDVFAFNCVSVQDGVEGKSDYCREMLYQWNPKLHYEVDLHQSLVGLRGPRINVPNPPCFYRHYKSHRDTVRSGARDFFIAGVWSDYPEGFEYWYKKTGQDPRINPGGPLIPNPTGIPYPLQTGFKIDAFEEMKYILEVFHPEVQYFRDLDKLIVSGEICSEFRAWAARHNATSDKRPHLAELHCFDEYIKMEKD